MDPVILYNDSYWIYSKFDFIDIYHLIHDKHNIQWTSGKGYHICPICIRNNCFALKLRLHTSTKTLFQFCVCVTHGGSWGELLDKVLNMLLKWKKSFYTICISEYAKRRSLPTDLERLIISY